METMQKNLQEFFTTMLEQKLEAKLTPLEAKLDPLVTDLRARVDAIATDLEAVQARAPAAPPRDPVQAHVSGMSHSVLELPSCATAETEDHHQRHVDQQFGPEYAHRGGEGSRDRRGVRHDDDLPFTPQGNGVPRARDQIDGGHERRFRRDGDLIPGVRTAAPHEPAQKPLAAVTSSAPPRPVPTCGEGDLAEELGLQFTSRGDGVLRGRHEVHPHDDHDRCFRRYGDHDHDRRGHDDNFDLAYAPRGHGLPHRVVHPHDDDAYRERPPRRDNAGWYDRRDSFHLKPPKHSFPAFKGHFPLLWIDNCYNYFEMYNVPDRHWVSTATLYFEDHAALWLQAYKRTHRQMNWDALITALVAEFGSDDYDGQMSSLLQLKQTGAVAEYKHKFESCMYHLLSVDAALNSKWFVSHFIHGLREEFRAAVRLQHPATVTKAAHLAQIQEEENDNCHRPRAGPAAAIKHHMAHIPQGPVEPHRDNDGFARERALRDFRQANGLCFRCGDKYSREHKCKPPAQLLTIQVGDCGEILSEDTVHALELLDEPTPAG